MPKATTQTMSAGAPVSARAVAPVSVAVASTDEADVLAVVLDVPVVAEAPELPLAPVPAVEVAVAAPEPGEIKKGAENTLGAVKSF